VKFRATRQPDGGDASFAVYLAQDGRQCFATD